MTQVLQFIGGLALFLYGMAALGKGLTKLSGGRLEGVLSRMCKTPLRGVFLGALVTAAIQSSSATTVMVVGFVNAGLMTLHHAVGVIMGANLGTTVTAWILSLSGISDDNFLLMLLKPASLAPLLTVLGAALCLIPKKEYLRDVGAGLVGFGLLFYGMEAMSGAVEPLTASPTFAGLLTVFQNPLAGLAAGALLTAVLQSSSASVGILQALTVTDAVTVGVAVPIVMGQNIGTCITALLSAVGAEKNAKRAAFIHLYFNAVGATVLLGVFYLLRLLGVVTVDAPLDEAGIALIHTLFNLSATALWLPFSKWLVKLASLTVRERRGEEVMQVREQLSLLDDRFLGSPSFALGVSRAAFYRMCELALERPLLSISQCIAPTEERARQIERSKLLCAQYEKELGRYLVKLSGARLHRREAGEISLLLSATPDAVRIGERAAGMERHTARLCEPGVSLSQAALEELTVIRSALNDLAARTRRLLRRGEAEQGRAAEALAGVVPQLCENVRLRHLARLRVGECDPEAANAFALLLADVESVAEHCKRLVGMGVRRYNNAFDVQRPMKALQEVDAEFAASFHHFLELYRL